MPFHLWHRCCLHPRHRRSILQPKKKVNWVAKIFLTTKTEKEKKTCFTRNSSSGNWWECDDFMAKIMWFIYYYFLFWLHIVLFSFCVGHKFHFLCLRSLSCLKLHLNPMKNVICEDRKLLSYFRCVESRKSTENHSFISSSLYHLRTSIYGNIFTFSSVSFYYNSFS